MMTRGERNGTNASAGEPPTATLEQRPQVLTRREPLDRHRRGQGFSGDVYRLRGRRARPDCYFRFAILPDVLLVSTAACGAAAELGGARCSSPPTPMQSMEPPKAPLQFSTMNQEKEEENEEEKKEKERGRKKKREMSLHKSKF